MWGQLANAASCAMDMSNTQNLSGLWKASQWVRQNNQHTDSEHPATPYQSSQNCLLFKTLHTHHPLQFFSLSPTQLLRCNPLQEHQPCLTSTHILPWRACTSSKGVTLNLHQLEWTEKIWLFPSSIHFPSIKKNCLPCWKYIETPDLKHLGVSEDDSNAGFDLKWAMKKIRAKAQIFLLILYSPLKYTYLKALFALISF